MGKRISMISIDCGGIRRGKEHTSTDRRCAVVNVIVIENLCNLPSVLSVKPHFTTGIAPVYFQESADCHAKW